MAFRFQWFLLAFTGLSLLGLSLAFVSVVHSALQQSAFGGAVLTDRRLGVDTEALRDFLSQVPLKKLLYMFLTGPHAILLCGLACNAALIVGWALQRLFFSGLARPSAQELRAARDSAAQFIVFRVIFLATIVDTSGGGGDTSAAAAAGAPVLAPGSGPLRDLACWSAWLSMVGLLRWFLTLLRERFHTAQASPHATEHTFRRYLALTLGFMAVNACMAVGALYAFLSFAGWAGLAGAALLLFENTIVALQATKVAAQYALYIRSLRAGQPWEERGSAAYYSGIACDVCCQLCTLAHLLHLWSHYGFSFSLLDLFLAMHIRQIVVDVWRSLRGARAYAQAVHDLDSRFPDATPQELQANADDVCSICRDNMAQAKKLGCGHLFHRSCIQQWCEHQPFCPTCRAPLQQQQQQRPQQQRPQQPPHLDPALYPAQAAEMAARAAAAAAGGRPAAAAAAAPGARVVALPFGGVASVGRQPVAGEGADASPNALHATGLRHRGHAATGSAHSSGSGAATSGEAAGSSVVAPAVGGAVAPHITVQPLFRFDTRDVAAWLPPVSFEVQSVRLEHAAGPTASIPTETAAAVANEEAKVEQQPAVEAASSAPSATAMAAPTSSAAASGAAGVALSASSSSAAAPAAKPSLRDHIWEATQRRLALAGAGSTSASAATSPSAAAAAEEGAQGSTAANTAAIEESSSSGSSSSGSGSSRSSSDALPVGPLAASTDSSASASSAPAAPLLHPSTRSPALLSQADADAALARALQAEEDLNLAAEGRRAGTVFSRFFGTL